LVLGGVANPFSKEEMFFFLTYGEVAFVRSVVLARRDFEELLVVASKIVMALHHCISSSEDA